MKLQSIFVKMLQSIFRKVASVVGGGLNTTKMVIVVRTDIGMSKGKMVSQVAHAAITLYQSSLDSSNPNLKTWMKWGQPKIILKVDNLNMLRTAYQQAVDSNLNACLIHDAGRTQLEQGTLTVLGIGPNKTEEIDKITGHFKLL